MCSSRSFPGLCDPCSQRLVDTCSFRNYCGSGHIRFRVFLHCQRFVATEHGSHSPNGTRFVNFLETLIPSRTDLGHGCRQMAGWAWPPSPFSGCQSILRPSVRTKTMGWNRDGLSVLPPQTTLSMLIKRVRNWARREPQKKAYIQPNSHDPYPLVDRWEIMSNYWCKTMIWWPKKIWGMGRYELCRGLTTGLT